MTWSLLMRCGCRWHLALGVAAVLGTGAAAHASAPAASAAESGLSWSLTLSPYHLAFPALFVSVERRLLTRVGLVLDVGAGSYRGARLGQLGARVPFDVLGRHRLRLQVGPFIRASLLSYANADAVRDSGGTSPHDVATPVYNDAEVIRSNGRDGVFYGALVGGEWISSGASRLPGATVRVGFLVGWVSLFGEAPYGSAPNASHRGGGFVPELYADVGWSF